MNTLCADIGNYSTLIAIVDGREVSEIVKLRSLVFDATHSEDCRNGLHDRTNPLINYQGRWYKVGEQAARFGAIAAVTEGKSNSSIVLPLLLSQVPDGFEGEVKFLIPGRDKLLESLISSAVVGTHEFMVCVGGGKDEKRLVSITSVNFHRESDSAALFGYQSGAIDPESTILLVDIGGGTCNVVVCSYENEDLNVIFRQSLEKSGGIALAEAIASTDFCKKRAKSFEASKIMGAISKGRRTIGASIDLDFSPVYDDCLNDWFRKLKNRVLSTTDRYLDDVSAIVWCGGGAEIIRPKLQGKDGHLILDNPQDANINGLIHRCKAPALRLAS